MEGNRNRCYVNFNDRENPVPGSAADIAKRQRETAEEKKRMADEENIRKTSDMYPAFGRIMELIRQDE